MSPVVSTKHYRGTTRSIIQFNGTNRTYKYYTKATDSETITDPHRPLSIRLWNTYPTAHCTATAAATST
ncbi:hypothetical protein PHLCEN_2v1652 [Hermanssonia centrifuga]|uniref:Uncharacterized protein n=1 Tax=Hermanssonia centrifuga TaxID=98765 RepID=A0A2R6RZE0_9APHY|nr:hypothetical protein PHLCEN_2v1652 [Hermanssonia centrifuga]